jgi:pimeloyl-ACP methyl ester carboxylesterase
VFAPVISYDRAGLGWSEASSGKLSLATMVRDLETVLNSTGLKTPYILVGHSFGTVVIRAFAFTHPGSVAGLVMVDPVSLESWARTTAADLRRLAVGVRLSRRGAVLAKWGVVRAALALAVSGSRRIPRLINQASSSKGSAVVERLLGEVRKMPQETWPLIQAHWSNPKSFRAMAAHLQCLPEAVRAAQEMPIDNSIPTIILSAASATASELSERDRWLNSHPLSRHVHVSETGHWLHLQQPELVVETVRELIGNVSSPVR